MGGPITAVDIEALRTAAKTFNDLATRMHDKAQPAIANTGLPAIAMPVMDMGYGAAYQEAWSGLNLACGLSCNVMNTIGLALTRVANHYAGQDAANASIFGGGAIPLPEVPPVSSMPNDTMWGDAVLGSAIIIAGVGAGLGMLIAAFNALLVSSARAGGVAIVLPIGAFCLLNVRDPIPHWHASYGWSAAQEVFAAAQTDTQVQADRVNGDAGWVGAGADAFNSYVTNVLASMLGAANALSADMESTSKEVGIFMTGTLVVSAVVTGMAVAACTAESAIPEPATATALIWFTLTGWATVIATVVADLVITMGELAAKAAVVGDGYNTLGRWLADQSGKLDGGSSNLTVTQNAAIQDWSQWGQE